MWVSSLNIKSLFTMKCNSKAVFHFQHYTQVPGWRPDNVVIIVTEQVLVAVIEITSLILTFGVALRIHLT
jgi:hypothetical protein